MTIEIGIVFAAIACIIGVAGYIGGKQTGAKKDGTEWGELKSDISHIQKDIEEIKISYLRDLREVKEDIKEETRAREESSRRLHIRADGLAEDINLKMQEHIKNFHNNH